MALELLITSLHWLGLTVYGGSLFAFAILLTWAARQPLSVGDRVVATYQLWGPGLGLSMGALIFSGLLRYYQLQGSFSWPMETTAQQLTAAKHALFLLLWLSSFHLEIWTLEPFRKLAGADRQIRDEAVWRATAHRASRQALFNAGLFVVIGLLAIAAARV